MATSFRDTQHAAIVLGRTAPGVFRDTQHAAVALGRAVPGAFFNTQHAAVVLADTFITPFIRITQAAAVIIGADDMATALRITQGGAVVAARSAPDFKWLNMFYPLRFPTGISDGSEANPRFATNTAQVDSGHDQSVSRWSEGLKVFNVGKGVDTMAKVNQLDAFFRIVLGRGIGFLYKDASDYSTAGFIGQEPGVTTNIDASIGTGDDVTTAFQLVKHYTYNDGQHAARQVNRSIYKPIASTVAIAVSGISVSNYTLNASTGLVTFIARASMAASDISFANSGSNGQILSVSSDFTVFVNGENLQIAGTSTVNATASETTLTITAITSHQIDFAVSVTTETAASAGLVTINVHPAPLSGQAATWGGEFDVPAKFGTDELPLSLEQYNVGQAQVLVNEIRFSTTTT